MRLNEFINELDLNPGTAFSKGFDRGSEVVDKVMSPSKWGDSTRSVSTKSKTSNSMQLKVDRFELKDAQEIMSAVIKGNVSDLSRQQIETAKTLLVRLNNL